MDKLQLTQEDVNSFFSEESQNKFEVVFEAKDMLELMEKVDNAGGMENALKIIWGWTKDPSVKLSFKQFYDLVMQATEDRIP